jgi:hypothetical protein
VVIKIDQHVSENTISIMYICSVTIWDRHPEEFSPEELTSIGEKE